MRYHQTGACQGSCAQKDESRNARMKRNAEVGKCGSHSVLSQGRGQEGGSVCCLQHFGAHLATLTSAPHTTPKKFERRKMCPFLLLWLWRLFWCMFINYSVLYILRTRVKSENLNKNVFRFLSSRNTCIRICKWTYTSTLFLSKWIYSLRNTHENILNEQITTYKKKEKRNMWMWV